MKDLEYKREDLEWTDRSLGLVYSFLTITLWPVFWLFQNSGIHVASNASLQESGPQGVAKLKSEFQSYSHYNVWNDL